METMTVNELRIPAADVTLYGDLVVPPDAEDEEAADQSGRYRFDIELLTGRLVAIADWSRLSHDMSRLALAIFGASTGAAAALDTAALRPRLIHAVVSRGGRPDLATRLESVHAPTLLIVGGNDHEVLRLNQIALHALPCFKRLDIVPGATHLFEEPGCLEHVATLARSWFTEYLR